MNIKISFHNMAHSDLLEAHTTKKLQKLLDFISDDQSPFYVEVRLTAHPTHPHHAVEIHLKTPHYDLNAHDQGTDMYPLVESTIDKIVHLYLKQKDKNDDKHKKVETEKTKFRLS